MLDETEQALLGELGLLVDSVDESHSDRGLLPSFSTSVAGGVSAG